MKNVVIMQARVNSSRLKAKVLREIKGKTILEHDIERIRQAKNIDGIIIATTTNEVDDAIVEVAEKCGVKHFRGSEEDVLERYYLAAKEFDVQHIIRITSDCPLIDPFIIDDIIEKYEKISPDIIANVPNEIKDMTYPRGLDLEIFSFEWLEKAYNEATKPFDREHVTTYIYDHAKNVYYDKYHKDYSKYRWTLDTDEDWQVINKIYENFYNGKHDFYFLDIVDYMEKHPEIVQINEGIKQKLKDVESIE
mgnify:CR=1 FL=1